jgi:lipopolysaccharide export system permease protein
VTRFDRYILGQLLGLFAFFTLLLVALYWVNRAVAVFEQIIADGQTARVFLELTVLSLPFIIGEVAPVAAFAAAAAVAHRMVGDSEMVVMQAAGFSAFRLARGAMLFAGLVALATTVLVHAIVPQSRVVLAERQAAITADVAARFLRDGAFQFPTPGIAFYIRRITPEGALENIYLADTRDPAQPVTYTARSAILTQTETGPKLLLRDGMVQVLDDARRLSVTRFADFGYDLGAAISPAGMGLRDAGALSTATLLQPDAAAEAATGMSRAALLYRGQHRMAQPVFAAAAALIGFASLLLGAFSRLGLWRQVLTGAVLLVAVYTVGTTAEGTGARDARLAWLAWLGPLSGIGTAALLLWLAQRTRRVRAAGPGAAT